MEGDTERTAGVPPHRSDERSRLRRGTVLVVGVGALGSAASLVLARCGIGRLILIDPDRVELSNLHRQVVHRTSSVGQPKVASAAAFLRSRFASLIVEAHPERLEPANLARRFASADFVIDATDGAAAKFLLNDGAVLCRQPFSHAGILGFRGQTMTVWPGRAACYRCLFPAPPDADEVASCRDAGIAGAVAGVIGSIQAAEAVRVLLGEPPALLDRLLTYDGTTGRWRLVVLRRNPRCPLCGERPTIAKLAAAEPANYGS